MTKKLKLILGLAALCGATLVCAACSADGSPYKNFDKSDYKISIRYENNGGMFASQENINIVDTYPLSAFENGGVKLLEPGSDKRGGGTTQTRSQISRSGYFLAGWYKTREPRFQDEAKTIMLDENGEVTADPEKQGYTYSDKWDFENSVLTIDKDKKYTSEEVVLTLYAAWVPNFKYEIYFQDGEEWKVVEGAQPQFNPTLQQPNLEVPKWNNESGAMEYDTFPQASGKTFSKIYSDKELQNEITEGILPHNGSWDTVAAVAFNAVQRYYTTWEDGVWFNIANEDQLIKNARADGCYNFNANLDFKDKTWPAAFSGEFKGKIIGNNHTISNITVNQTDANNTVNGGLFGVVTDSVEIKDIIFDNVVYSMKDGSRRPGASFGLFAGTLSENAKIENVKINGEIQIGNIYNLRGGGEAYGGYSIGLVSGNGVKKGITYDNITCKSVPVQSGTATIYPVIVTVNQEEETVTVKQNPDRTKDPNAVNSD